MKTTLAEDLGKQIEKFNSTASDSKKELYARAFAEVERSGILEKALNVGDHVPDFTLTDQLGKPFSLYQKLNDGPVILMWYRGGWCPYCNITLHHMKSYLPEMNRHGASLVAITPELPDQSLDTVEKHQLEFTVVSDVGNHVARKYGVVFKLNPGIAKIYQESFGLHEVNGDDSEELPLAATYIINQNQTIEYAFVHHDYRVRAEPEDILKALSEINATG